MNMKPSSISSTLTGSGLSYPSHNPDWISLVTLIKMRKYFRCNLHNLSIVQRILRTSCKR